MLHFLPAPMQPGTIKVTLALPIISVRRGDFVISPSSVPPPSPSSDDVIYEQPRSSRRQGFGGWDLGWICCYWPRYSVN